MGAVHQALSSSQQHHREKKEKRGSLSHSLIGDPEVLIKGMTSLPIPVHQVYLHQVPPFKSKDTQVHNSLLW